MPTLSRRSKALIATAVIVLVVLLVGPRLITIYTDWLWFKDIGYSAVFSKIIWTRIALFAICGAIAGLIIFGTLWLAYRSRPVFVPTSGPGDPIARYRTVVMSRIRWFSIIPTLMIGLLAGLVAQGSWSTVQMFLNGESFGTKDPEFGLDVGFYAFDLPFYRFVLNYLFVIVVIAFVVSLVTHYIFGGIRLAGRGGTLTSAARVQLAVIAGTFLLLKAIAYWLDRYTLLSSTRKGDIFNGASYTDINAVLPSKLILMAIAIICALAFFAGVVLRDLRIPALATAMMLLSALVIGVGWPAAMEQFSVKPNAAEKEAEFINRNIEATKQAYGIGDDVVTTQPDWTGAPASSEKVDADAATLSNIRLLDPNIVSPAFTQLKRQQNFYGFPSQLALDRYSVDGEMRDFVVAARELDPTKFEANQQNWLNKHTVYTHGNGFIAAPANTVNAAVASENDVSGGGEPVFNVSDLSNYETPEYKANAPIKVAQPRIYFGELISKVNPDYAIVGNNGDPREYDTGQAKYTYQGDAGVPLSNWFNRFAYSVKYTERNLLLSGAINSDSKIIYNRDPRDRVKKAAPWLTVDSKTYPAVMADGSIKWIVDGYTTLDAFPYAQSMSLEDATTDAQQLNQGQTGRSQVNRKVSYVRNSVKATVDAYSGEVTLYQFDEKDPVLKTWMKVFPGSVKSRAEFDSADNKSLRDHVRYPEDLFKIQRQLLTKYHVTDPQTFFQGDAFWSVPSDPTDKAAVNQGLDQPPYYFVASDPETKAPSFQLTSVFNVLKQEILAAYVTVSSDPDNYGQITIKSLPSNTQREGPKQVFSAMSSETGVAASLKSLENTADVTFGNLLTLPVGDNGILNVVPMYAQAKSATGTFPRLIRVIVRYDNSSGQPVRIGFAPTVAAALDGVGIDPSTVTQIPGGAQGQPQPNGPEQTPQQANQPNQAPANSAAVPSSPQRDAIVGRINDALTAMQAALKNGDFTAYGQAQTDLLKATQDYEELPKG